MWSPEHEQRRELTGPISRGLRVDRLRPFTSYRMAVALVTGGEEGPRSAPKDTRTMEAVPDTTPTVTEVRQPASASPRQWVGRCGLLPFSREKNRRHISAKCRDSYFRRMLHRSQI